MHASNEDEHFGTEQQYSLNGCPANERFNQRLIQCAPNVILFLSPDHLILEFNPEAERLYGRKREDVLGKDYFEEFLPDDAREAVAADIEKVLAGEPTRGFENVVITHDGQEQVLSWNIDRVLDSNDKPIGIVVVGQDITERKQSDIALSELLQTSYDIVRAIPSGLFIYRYEAPDSLSLLYGNPEAERLTGIKVAEWLGKEFNEIWPNVKEQGITDAFLSPMKTGQTYETEDLYYKDEKLEGAFRVRTFQLPGHKLAVAFENINEQKRAEEALQESENHYRSVVENTGEGIVVVQDGILQLINPYFRDITGYSEKEFMSRPFIEFVHPDDRERVMGIHTKRLKGEEVPHSYKFRAVDKQGNTMWLENNGILIEWDGRPASLNFLRDITSRKKAEEALQESEERLKILFESAPDAYYIHDLEGKFIDGNRAAEELLGYQKDEAIGKSFFELGMVTEADIPKSMAAMADNIDGKPAGPLELTLNHKDGSKVIVETRSYPVDIAGETLILGIARDITERKKAEAALAESEQRFREFFENEPEYCYMVSPQGTILEANHAVFNTLGYTAEELAGKQLMTIYAPEFHQRMHQLLTQWAQTGEIRDEEMVIQTKNGDKRTVLLSATQVLDENGQLLHSVSIQRDITERKEAEEALRAERDKLKAFMDGITRAGIGIDIVGADYKVLFQNQTLEERFGKISEKSCYEHYTAQQEPCDSCSVTKAIQQNAAIETEQRGHDGRDYQIFTAPVPEADGSVSKAIEIVMDITERKLAEAERARLIDILEITSDFVSTATPDGELTYLNRAGKRILGWPEDESCNGRGIPNCHPDWAFNIIKNEGIPAAIEHGVWEGETALLRSDSTEIPVSQVIMAHKSSTGEVEYFSTIIRDITERKQAEEALKQNEERFRSLSEAAFEGIAFTEKGVLVDANEAFARIYHCSLGELKGRQVIELVAPEHRELVEEHIRSSYKGVYEHQGLRKDGSLIALEVQGRNVEYQGRTMRLTAIRDITERKVAEEKLRESEERLTKAFRASPNLMGIVDLDERHRLLGNDACARITGYSLEEIIGSTFDELNFWVEPDRLHEAMRVIRQDGVLQDYETDIRTKQGEIRTLTYNAVLLDIPGKNVVAFSAEDITEQKEAEKRIKEYQAQLKSLASELSLAEEHERRRIATGIHDDIAQKLAMAKFSLQSLQASVKDADISGSLEKQCQLMEQVVADARSLTFELGNPVLYQVGLEAAVESYLTERVQEEFGIECKFTSEGPPSSFDEDITIVLFQSARELLANVVKHANASTIEVDISNTKDKLRIVVKDDGIGFDPSEIGPHAMEQGGFGLFNIRERLEYFGGNIEIESRPKNGTCVTMTIAMRKDAITE